MAITKGLTNFFGKLAGLGKDEVGSLAKAAQKATGASGKELNGLLYDYANQLSHLSKDDAKALIKQHTEQFERIGNLGENQKGFMDSYHKAIGTEKNSLYTLGQAGLYDVNPATGKGTYSLKGFSKSIESDLNKTRKAIIEKKAAVKNDMATLERAGLDSSALSQELYNLNMGGKNARASYRSLNTETNAKRHGPIGRKIEENELPRKTNSPYDSLIDKHQKEAGELSLAQKDMYREAKSSAALINKMKEKGDLKGLGKYLGQDIKDVKQVDTAAEKFLKGKMEAGPTFGNYISGYKVPQTAGGLAIIAGTAASVFGDGKKSNAELYSSPF